MDQCRHCEAGEWFEQGELILHTHIARGLATLALLILVPVIARADAVSDQKKAYEKMGIKIPHPPAMCNLVTASEASRAIGKAVKAGESAGPLSGCAYKAADGSNDGILVTRGDRSDWYPPTTAAGYRTISGLGEKAYVANEMSIGYEAAVMTAKGLTSVLVAGSKSPDAALALVRIAMSR